MAPLGKPVDQTIGVLIAIVSSCLGGTAAAVTRYLVGNADPITLAILRWGIGFLCVLPVALLLRVQMAAARATGRRSPRSGICFFGLFFVLYNIAVGYTTAARASLALSTLPLQTMVVGALLGIEPLTRAQIARRRASPCSACSRALASGLAAAPRGRLARRTDHDRRRAVHGVLQCLVAALHPAIERAWLSRRRHGRRRRRARSWSGC